MARQLFPDVLPYVVGTPATFGFAARNGRTLADNAPEAMFSLVTGTAIPAGLRPAMAKNQAVRRLSLRHPRQLNPQSRVGRCWSRGPVTAAAPSRTGRGKNNATRYRRARERDTGKSSAQK